MHFVFFFYYKICITSTLKLIFYNQIYSSCLLNVPEKREWNGKEQNRIWWVYELEPDFRFITQFYHWVVKCHWANSWFLFLHLNLENNLLCFRDFYKTYYFSRTLPVKLELVFHHSLMSLNKQNTGIMSLKNIGILILMIFLTTNWSLNIFVSFLRLIIQGGEHIHFKMYFSLKTFF